MNHPNRSKLRLRKVTRIETFAGGGEVEYVHWDITCGLNVLDRFSTKRQAEQALARFKDTPPSEKSA